MHLHTIPQEIEVVSAKHAKTHDTLRVSVRHVDRAGEECPLWLTFRPTTRAGRYIGPGWFVLDVANSDIWVRSQLQNKALRLYRDLPWWRRLNRDRDADIRWVEQHVEFAVRSGFSADHELHWGRRPVKGQLVKGWWLEVIPLVDGERVRTNFPDDIITFEWPVGDVIIKDPSRALSFA